jgi:proteic killer suppression protein
MIRNFRHKGLQRFFETGNTKGINPNHAKRLKVRLEIMDEAEELEQLDQPGWNFHELSGDRQGTFSIHVNGNWCLTFQFQEGDCLNVDYEDYH